jgi:hypothetical protein
MYAKPAPARTARKTGTRTSQIQRLRRKAATVLKVRVESAIVVSSANRSRAVTPGSGATPSTSGQWVWPAFQAAAGIPSGCQEVVPRSTTIYRINAKGQVTINEGGRGAYVASGAGNEARISSEPGRRSSPGSSTPSFNESSTASQSSRSSSWRSCSGVALERYLGSKPAFFRSSRSWPRWRSPGPTSPFCS